MEYNPTAGNKGLKLLKVYSFDCKVLGHNIVGALYIHTKKSTVPWCTVEFPPRIVVDAKINAVIFHSESNRMHM